MKAYAISLAILAAMIAATLVAYRLWDAYVVVYDYQPAYQAQQQAQQPAHRLTVLSVTCNPNPKYNHPSADVAVLNSGLTTIEYPKAVVNFGGEMHDAYMTPFTLQPGGIATHEVIANKGSSADCSLVAVQGMDGFPVALTYQEK